MNSYNAVGYSEWITLILFMLLPATISWIVLKKKSKLIIGIGVLLGLFMSWIGLLISFFILKNIDSKK